jgi:DNA-binding transcriptional MerR regulator
VVVAKLYDLSVSTLGRWRRNGYGPPWQEEHTPGGGVIHLYPEADAIRWGREHGYIHNGDTP